MQADGADGQTLQAHLLNKSAKEPSAKESGTAQWPLARPSGCELSNRSKLLTNAAKLKFNN